MSNRASRSRSSSSSSGDSDGGDDVEMEEDVNERGGELIGKCGEVDWSADCDVALSFVAEGLTRVDSLLESDQVYPLGRVRVVNLHGNGLKSAASIESLSAFENLIALRLSSNQFSCLPWASLSLLHHLAVLDLAGNCITKLSDEKANSQPIMPPRLRFLNLAYNRISDLAGFADSTSLRQLDLRNNRIARMKELEPLTRCPNLDTLLLADGTSAMGHSRDHNDQSNSDIDNVASVVSPLRSNPICSRSNYPASVLELLPQITILDGHACFNAAREHRHEHVSGSASASSSSSSSSTSSGSSSDSVDDDDDDNDNSDEKGLSKPMQSPQPPSRRQLSLTPRFDELSQEYRDRRKLLSGTRNHNPWRAGGSVRAAKWLRTSSRPRKGLSPQNRSPSPQPASVGRRTRTASAKSEMPSMDEATHHSESEQERKGASAEPDAVELLADLLGKRLGPTLRAGAQHVEGAQAQQQQHEQQAALMERIAALEEQLASKAQAATPTSTALVVKEEEPKRATRPQKAVHANVQTDMSCRDLQLANDDHERLSMELCNVQELLEQCTSRMDEAQAQRSEALQTVDVLRQQINEHEKLIAALQDRKHALEERSRQGELERDNLESELVSAKRQRDEALRELKQAHHASSIAQSQLGKRASALAARLREKDKAKMALEIQVASINQEVEQVFSSVEALKSTESELRSQLAQERRAHATTKETWSSEVQALRSDVGRVKQALSRGREQMDKLTTELKKTRESHQAEKTDLQRSNDKLRNGNKELAQLVEQQRARLEQHARLHIERRRETAQLQEQANAAAKLHDDLERANEEQQKLGGRIQQLERELLEAMTREGQAQADVKQQKSTHEQLKQEHAIAMDDVRAAVKIKVAMLEDQNRTISELRATLQRVEQERKDSTAELQSANERLTDSEREVRRLEHELEASESAARDLEGLVDDLRENEVTSERFTAEMNKKAALLQKLEQEVSTFREDLSWRDHEIDRLKTVVKEKDRSADALRNDLSDARKRQREAVDELHKTQERWEDAQQSLEAEKVIVADLNQSMAIMRAQLVEQQKRAADQTEHVRKQDQLVVEMRKDAKVLAKALEAERRKRESSVQKVAALYRELGDG